MSKTVIIGGVAGGATAAARLRRRDESMEIVMLEKGEYISFANCGLPYYIGDVIHSRESLLLQTPEGMKKKIQYRCTYLPGGCRRPSGGKYSYGTESEDRRNL